ncbi:MAG: CoB--CoM heterodisulfide reductase iron-sulfur subunit A family protein [Chloroflexota bacterium]|nr:CoB--CoM heterodisulfide reductase iron-sulfur subunit A family protein [Chloroflexota bacterium]
MEEVKIGVYVCHCGLNIAGTVDCEEVAKYAGTLPNVVISRDYRYMCSDPGQDLIKNDIKELGLNRVVVASCSPLMHERTFRATCLDAGLNPYLYEQVNIREHCSWPHATDKEIATEKAKDLVRGAVRRVYWQEPLEIKEVPVNPNVLVVGGGIAGIQAALDIANGEHKVYLLERDPSVGGHMAQFDRTFPTLDCSECILTPKMAEVGHHPFIELLTYSEVEEVSGSVGNFHVKVRKKARHIDESKCVGCGVCMEKCPWKTDSEFEVGMAKRPAAYITSAIAVPNLATIDPDLCVYIKSEGKKCGACIKFCEAGAITSETLLEQTDQIIEFDVGAIIVATGYEIFDSRRMPQYGYGKYDNVLTGLQFERVTCAGGPSKGRIQLKDGREPESVALIHCVGSRDTNYNEYCSRVCCMYGLKYAYLIKEMLPNTEVYQFYIDMRCYGEGFEEFYKHISEMGVNFIRGKVAQVTDRAIIDEEKGKLIVVAEDTLLGKMIRVPADMVILLIALESRPDAADVASKFTLNRRADGFFLEKHVKLEPVSTATDGVFIAGCCEGPKDIPDTVAQASAAASKVLSMLSKGRITLEAAIAHVDETICHGCGRCEEICTFHAPRIISKNGTKVCSINESLCKGCGACAVVCPTGAMSIWHFSQQEIESLVDGLLEVYHG